MATFTFSPFYMVNSHPFLHYKQFSSDFNFLDTFAYTIKIRQWELHFNLISCLHFTEDIFFLQICMFWQKSLLHVLANWLQLRPMTVSSELLYRVAAGFPTGNDIPAWNYTKAVANLHFINQTLFRWHVLIEDQPMLNESLQVNVVLDLSKQATFIFFDQFPWHNDY